jgi:tetratricopeptide (TPR) repeat protein
LDSLVGAHLLEQLQPDRYQFHDLLRLYALDQARTEESPAAYQQAVRRILVWYAHSVAEAGTLLAPDFEPLTLPELGGVVAPMRFGDHQAAYVWFVHEEAVLHAAVHLADEVLMPDLAWLLAALLYPVYAHRNQVDQWITTSTVGLGAARQLDDRDGEARTLTSLGMAHTQSSNPRDGIRFQEAALAIHQELGNRTGEVTSTNAIGLAHLRLRDLADALRHFERTSAVAEELDSDFWRAITANNTASVLLELDQFPEAAALLRSALPTHRRLIMRGSEGDALRSLSHAHRGLGVPDEAREFIDEALTIARDHENIAWEAHWLVESGHVLLDLDEPEEALVAYQRAAVLHRRLGDRGREAAALDGAGLAYQRLDRPDEAADFHRLAVAAFRAIGDQWQLAVALTHLGVALGGDQDADREALNLLAPFSDPRAVRLQEAIRARLS